MHPLSVSLIWKVSVENGGHRLGNYTKICWLIILRFQRQFYSFTEQWERSFSPRQTLSLRFLSFLLQIVGVRNVCRLFCWDVLLLAEYYCAEKQSEMGTERFTRSLIDMFSHRFTPQNDSYQGKQEDHEPNTNLSAGFLRQSLLKSPLKAVSGACVK